MTLPNLATLAYAALAAIGIAAATGVMAYRSGYDAAVLKAQAEQAKHLREAIRQADEIAAQDREIYAAGDARQARIETVFRTLDREVIRYVQTHADAADCLDGYGMRLWSAANAGRAPTVSGDGAQPGALPGGAAAAALGPGAGPAGGSHGAGGVVSPPAQRLPDAGGVGAGRPFWGWR